MRVSFKAGVAAGIAALALTFAPVADAQDKTAVVKAVGTWGNLSNYKTHEGPFWNEVIAKASGGSIQGEIKPQTDLGLKGFEIMRLLKLGVFDFAHGLIGYVAAENAVFEGADLSSVVQDIKTQRKVADAYFPIMAKAFEEIYDSKLLQLYTFPSQMLWCNAEINNMADLKGKKIRVYSTTLGDFVEGVGASSVTVPFAEVIPALEKGVVDCGITGTTPAYNAKWYQAATHAYTMRVGWGLSFGAMNMKKWNSLSKAQQDILQKEIAALTDRMWTETEREDAAAVSCITGGKCELGEPANMKLVEPSAADLEARDKIAEEVILARWAERCGKECADQWNEVIGPILGLKATVK